MRAANPRKEQIWLLQGINRATKSNNRPIIPTQSHQLNQICLLEKAKGKNCGEGVPNPMPMEYDRRQKKELLSKTTVPNN